MIRILSPLLLASLLIAGCSFGVPIGDRGKLVISNSGGSSSQQPKKSSSGNPTSYVVFGKRYYVLDNADGFVERGIASWYGIKFHGRKTSSGEVYNMHAMTAAHKNLPLPTWVHVKNLDNGRTAVVKVNDRGPFVDGRIIDLSYAAASKLGVKGPGTANVIIHAIEKGQTRPTNSVRLVPLTDQPEKDVPLFIQMGSFSSQANASNLVRDLKAANENSARISRLQTENGLFYRVRVGPLYDIDEANAIVERLRNKGFQTARIVVQD